MALADRHHPAALFPSLQPAGPPGVGKAPAAGRAAGFHALASEVLGARCFFLDTPMCCEEEFWADGSREFRDAVSAEIEAAFENGLATYDLLLSHHATVLDNFAGLHNRLDDLEEKVDVLIEKQQELRELVVRLAMEENLTNAVPQISLFTRPGHDGIERIRQLVLETISAFEASHGRELTVARAHVQTGDRYVSQGNFGRAYSFYRDAYFYAK